MKGRFPLPSYAWDYRNAPVSGNVINGLGEAVSRRARPVFHGSGLRRLEWELLELYFLMAMQFRLFWPGVVSRWVLRRGNGPVNPVRMPVRDEVAMAAEIKRLVLQSGAGAVGISRVSDRALYSGAPTAQRVAGAIRFTHEAGLNESPTWSPDGKLVAFASNHSGNFEIFVRRADGGQEVKVTSDPAEDLQPAFSSDGTSIAFRRLSGVGNGELGTWDLLTLRLDGVSAPGVIATGALFRGAPDWGAKGILYVETDAAASRSQHVLVQPDGSGRTVLRTEDAGYLMGEPRWLPGS